MKITPDKYLRNLIGKAYPEYRGRKVYLKVTDAPINVASWWDGGSRDYYVFANLATGETSQQVPAQSGYDKPIDGAKAVKLPENFICLEHSIFCGKDAGITIHVLPANAAKFLPENVTR